MKKAVLAALCMFVLPVLSSTIRAESTQQEQTSKSDTNSKGTQTRIEQVQIESFKSSAEKELEQNILGFWMKYCLDEENGGFVGRMTNDRSIEKDAPKGLVLNARILWTFSAAYRYKKNNEYLNMAGRAFDYLMRHFMDTQYGGAYWMLDSRGKPLNDNKELYGQSFLIYGLAEYFLAAGDKDALEKAKELFGLIEKHCHDDTNKGYFETFRRDWSVTEPATMADGDTLAKKTMNSHLHLLEAYTSLYRVWKNPELKTRIEELLGLFHERIVNTKTFHLDLAFDSQWRPTAHKISFGHDIEAGWLMCEAARVLADEQLIKQTQALALKMTEAVCREGFDADGGLVLEAEEGRITRPQKDWWPQAEAAVGLLNAYQISNQQRFFRQARRSWLFIQEHIVDGQYGEWLLKASPDGSPDKKELKISEWKCPYHNSRACLEIIRRLDEIEK